MKDKFPFSNSLNYLFSFIFNDRQLRRGKNLDNSFKRRYVMILLWQRKDAFRVRVTQAVRMKKLKRVNQSAVRC